jgi:hypothetical protein
MASVIRGSDNLDSATAGAGGTNSFIAKLSGTQSTSINTWTKINMSSEAVDVGNNYANSRYTVPVSGVYFVSISVQVPSMTSNADTAYIRVYVNGSNSGVSDTTETQTGSASGGALLQCQMVGLMSLTAGQYIEAYIYQTGGTRALQIVGSSFAGFRLS